MARKKNYSLPVRLRSQVKHSHVSYYLHYINQIAPEVGAELKKLTPTCEKLFGKFPILNFTIDDNKNLGVWIFKQRENTEQNKAWHKIGYIFRDCIWKESREPSSWLDYLRENDDKLKQIYEFEENQKIKLFKFIESLPEEKLNILRDVFASRYTKSKESLDTLDLQYSYLDYERSILWENDKDFAEMMQSKYSKIEPLEQFQENFDVLLQKFCLGKEWLAASAFIAIWNGTGKLQIDPSIVEVIPDEIIAEINKRLKEENPAREDKNIPDFFYLPFTTIPLPNPFTFHKEYLIYYPFETYEEQAVQAYRQHIQNYFKVVKESFKRHGYKEPRGDKYDYERLKWLVRWNVTSITKEELIQEIVDTTNDSIDPSTINKAFIKFRNYDLPVRQ